jgi:hypothetical protein
MLSPPIWFQQNIKQLEKESVLKLEPV